MPKTSVRTSDRSTKSREWLAKFPYFLGAILAHLILFLMVGTWIVFNAPIHEPDPTFQGVKIVVPPPPPAPPAPSGGEARNELEPALQVTPPVAAPSVISVNMSTSFNVSPVHLPQPTLSSLARPTGSGLANTGASGAGAGASSVFGSAQDGGNGLTGYFYDLKQTPDHQPTGMDADKEQALLKKFFSSGWNEDTWASRFLKSPQPLFANEMLVPLELSQQGPKSFGLEKVCEPGYWVAIYHLKIGAGRSGNFRLAGYGDDFLVARVNGEIVLDSGYYPPVTNFKRNRIYPSNWLKRHPENRPDYAQTVVGPSFRLEPAESVTVDVLIGDAYAPVGGNGICGYFLFLLEDGKDYPNDADGNPILPLFQVQRNPGLQRTGGHPPFTVNAGDTLLGN